MALAAVVELAVGNSQGGISATRLSVLLNSALDVIKKDNSNAFVASTRFLTKR